MLFNVDDEGAVSLHIGAFGVEVCKDPRDFEEFIQHLNNQLETIRQELVEYYVED